MAQYYYLVSGLPNVNLDDGKLNYTVENFKTDIYPDLSDKDKKLIDLFYLKFDNENLLKLLKDKDAKIDSRGNYTADDLLRLIASSKEGENPKEYPMYLFDFLSAYFKMIANGEIKLPENMLASYYYEYAMKCPNKFISSWFELNLNVNNILAAFAARKYKIEVGLNIVGNTEISQQIRTSNARDFGISDEIIYFDELARINETHDLVEREKKLDQLKWNWLEEESFFNYFTIEKLFVFLIKLEMIERWISLDKETGNQLFRQLISDLKGEVQIPVEFRK